jgi:hypothetical protein
VLAAKAPSLHKALEKAVDQGIPYVILDGSLISSDRCSDKKTSRKGAEIDKWYSGKAHEHVGLVRGTIAPSGIPCGYQTPCPDPPTTSPPPASRSSPVLQSRFDVQ